MSKSYDTMKKFLVKSNDEIDENIDNSLHVSEDEIEVILELFQSLSET